MEFGWRAYGERIAEPDGQVASQKLGGRVRYRQQNAIASREYPAALLKSHFHTLVVRLDANHRMPRRQQHAVV